MHFKSRMCFQNLESAIVVLFFIIIFNLSYKKKDQTHSCACENESKIKCCMFV